MLSKKITSLQHPIVKHFVKLRESRKTRYVKKRVPILGIKQVEANPFVETLFIVPPFQTQTQANECYHVTEEILKKLSGHPSPEPIAALATMPEYVDLRNLRRLIALDQVTDPGNVGTLIRTALALGFNGLFLTEGSADPFNEKALRSAMGATFFLPLQLGSQSQLIEIAQKFSPLIADAKGTMLEKLPPIQNPLLILGNEASGVSNALKQLYPAVSIPIEKIESLNVSAAGAILMYNLSKSGSEVNNHE